jgi:predicted XRE-type DNA-binding protein
MARKKDKDLVITKGSGNVFLDLGFTKEKAEDLFARSELMSEICNIIKKNKIKTKDLCLLWNVSPSRVYDLKSGKINKFSKGMLACFLEILNDEKIWDQIDIKLIEQSEKDIAEHGTISLEEFEKRMGM